MKIAWICHFSNEEICERLSLYKKVDEFASWIPNILKGFEEREDVEMHVIVPYYFLKSKTNIKLRNINYYFIPVGIPLWHRPFPAQIPIDVLGNLYSFRRNTKKIIDMIKPNLINLIGAENSYYSSSIINYKDSYPVLITIQGFISQISNKLSLRDHHRAYIEKRILRKFKYFLGDMDSKTYISLFNQNYIFFKVFFPVNEVLISEISNKEKKYDCIYFGTLIKRKGIEDFIKIISEIKKSIPDIKGLVIGPGDDKPFKKLTKELDCESNIEFAGYAKNQEVLFKYVKTSKVFLAPPYFERLSSTIREAMFLKVPIVAYATGGIPYINEKDENIFIVKTGDFKEMARKTLLLLNNEKLKNSLAEKAFKYAQNEFSLKVNIERMMNAYHFVINHYKTNHFQ